MSDEQAEGTEDEELQLSLSFTGSAWEYFRIWVVNTFLSLVTFGVFSAWGKVRKKRYLYAHTLIDGTPLRYLGQPIPILKGRCVALVLAGIWYTVTRHYQFLYYWLLGAAAFVLPWIMLKTATFTARSTSFRNITFDFKSSYKQTLGLVLGGIFGTALTAGIGYPLAQHRLRRWLVRSAYYGRERWHFRARAGSFYRIYIGAVAFGTVLLLGGACAASAMQPSSAYLPWYYTAATFDPRYYVGFTYGMYLLLAAIISTWVTNRVWRSSSVGPLRFDCRLRARDMLWLYASNTLLIVASAGLLTPWASLRLVRYRSSCLTIFARGDLQQLEGATSRVGSAAGAETAEVFDLDISL